MITTTTTQISVHQPRITKTRSSPSSSETHRKYCKTLRKLVAAPSKGSQKRLQHFITILTMAFLASRAVYCCTLLEPTHAVLSLSLSVAFHQSNLSKMCFTTPNPLAKILVPVPPCMSLSGGGGVMSFSSNNLLTIICCDTHLAITETKQTQFPRYHVSNLRDGLASISNYWRQLAVDFKESSTRNGTVFTTHRQMSVGCTAELACKFISFDLFPDALCMQVAFKLLFSPEDHCLGSCHLGSEHVIPGDHPRRDSK